MTALLEKQESAVAFDQAKALTVKTVPARQMAADLWDAIRAFRKQAEAQKEEVCRPLKTAWDSAKVPFDTFVKECQGHEAALQQKMTAWDREQDRLAREEQARLQAITDKANEKKLAKAEAKGLDVSEVALKVAPVVVAPPKAIETQAGTTQTRTVKKVYTPKDTTTLMRDFPQLFELSMPKFNALAKTGMLDNRPDVEITEEYIYSQR
jgi:hypothetical protein